MRTSNLISKGRRWLSETRHSKRPTRPHCRFALEALEDRIVPDSATYGGLEFLTSGAFSTSSTLMSTSASVQVGLAPASGASFVPLLTLEDGVQFAPASATGRLTTFGGVDATVGGLDIPLLGSGTNILSATALSSAAGFALTSLQNLDAPSLSVAGVDFDLSDIALTNSGIELQGSLSVPGLAGLSVAVNGSNYVQINSSGVELTGVNASISQPETLTLAGLSLTVNSLNVTYTSSSSTFDISGSGTLALAGATVNVNLGSSGSSGTPGLVVQDGTVTSFNLALTGTNSFSVAGATITPTSLSASYTQNTDTLTISGDASLSVGKIVSGMTVDLGGSDTAGLTIQNGSVQSFDGSVSAKSISIAGLSFTNVTMSVDYQSSSADLTISGSGTFSLPGTSSSVSVTLGTTSTPGIEISNGSLSQLNFAINSSSSFSIAGVTIDPQSLSVSYVQSSQTLNISGAATFSVGSVIQDVSITLGQGSTPGIDIVNGTLKSIDASVSGSIDVLGATITANDLTVEYGSNGDFEIYGKNVVFSFGQTSMSATLGNQNAPGLVVNDGSLQSLNISVTGNLDLFGLTVTADNLTVAYDSANGDLEFSGGIGVTLPSGIASGELNLSQGGLIINTKTGALSVDTTNGLAVTGAIALGGAFKAEASFSYSDSDGSFSLAANLEVTFPGAFEVGGSFDIVNGQLNGVSFNYTATAPEDDIPIGDTGLFITQLSGSLSGLSTPKDISFSGSVTVSAGESVTIGSKSVSLLSMAGTLTVSAQQFDLSGNLTMFGGAAGGSANMTLNWTTGVYQITGVESEYDDLFSISESLTITNTGMIALQGSASVNVPEGLPSAVYTALHVSAGQSLASANIYLQIDLAQNAPTSDTYAMAWINLPAGVLQAGFKVAWEGGDSFDVSGYAKSPLAKDAKAAFNAVEKGAVKAWRALGDSAEVVGQAIVNGFSTFGTDFDAIFSRLFSMSNVATVMNEVGYGVTQIADFMLSAGEGIQNTASYLESALGTSAKTLLTDIDTAAQQWLNQLADLGSAAKIAAELVEITLPAQFAQTLETVFHDSTSQIAEFFKVTFPQYTAQEVEEALGAIGAAESDTVNAIKQWYGVSISTGESIWNSFVSGLSSFASEVGNALDPLNW